MTYRFVGVETELFGGRVKLTRLGQSIDLDEATASVVIKGGGAIVSESDFKALGFTDDELKQYAYAGPRLSAPPEFHAKLQRAHAMFCELKNKHENGIGAAEVQHQAAPEAPQEGIE